MGNASSTNVAKIITDVHANVATSILQNQDISQNNSQIIRIVGGSGDVNITNNTFKITANVNMSALQTAMTESSAKNAIKNQLEQAAKTLTTGISLLQFTDARNTIDLFVKTGVELTTTITQTCSFQQNNVQTIELENRIGGNITVSGNVFEQLAVIFSNCSQSAVAKNAVVQSIQNKVDQASSATVKGASLATLLALGLALVALPALVGVAALRPLLKYLFPILIVVGVVMLAFYFARKSYYMTSYGYAPALDSKCPGSTKKELAVSTYTDGSQAEAACLADDKCQAYDFRANTVDPVTGAVTPLPQQQTVFYTSVSNGCEQVVSASLEAGNATDAVILDAVGFKKTQRSTLLLVSALGLLIGGVLGTVVLYRTQDV
jgi:hypothetical protein